VARTTLCLLPFSDVGLRAHGLFLGQAGFLRKPGRAQARGLLSRIDSTYRMDSIEAAESCCDITSAYVVLITMQNLPISSCMKTEQCFGSHNDTCDSLPPDYIKDFLVIIYVEPGLKIGDVCWSSCGKYAHPWSQVFRFAGTKKPKSSTSRFHFPDDA
jgi:hypothetical protein